MYIRGRKVRDTWYYHLVERYRDGLGRSRMRTVASLGRARSLLEARDAVTREIQLLSAELHAMGEGPHRGREARVHDRLLARIAREGRKLVVITYALVRLEDNKL
jgi:hypothetical protein